MKIITIGACKGGVGKTTTAHLLIEGLRKKGYKVLGIDLDYQMNLSKNYKRGKSLSSYELMTGSPIDMCISNDMIFGSENLERIDSSLRELGSEYILAESLLEVHEKYDYCVIDVHPDKFKKLNINAYVASDFMVIPAVPDFYDEMSVIDTLKAVAGAKKYYKSKIEKSFVLMTRYRDTNYHKEIRSHMIQNIASYDAEMLNTSIRYDEAISEAISYGETVFTFKPYSKGSKDYSLLIDELLSKIEPNYSMSVFNFKIPSLELWNYVENMSFSNFMSELEKAYPNPKGFTYNDFIQKFESVDSMYLKLILLFSVYKKNGIQALSYYKKIFEDPTLYQVTAKEKFVKLFKLEEN